MSTGLAAPRLTICGTPELIEHFAAGVTHVLSILVPTMPDPTGFAAFAPHRGLVLRFNDVIEPRPDQIAPSRQSCRRAANGAADHRVHRRSACEKPAYRASRPGDWHTRVRDRARTSYVVPYRVRADALEILRVYHGARRWPDSFP